MKRRLIFIIILPFLLVGCGPSPEEIATQTAAAWTATPTITNTPTPTPIPPTATPTLAPTPTPLSPEALLETAFANTAEAETYHFEMIMLMSMTSGEISMDIPLTYIGDVKAPDRQQGKLTMEFLGVTMESEVIIIGETSYTTDPTTGEWDTGTTDLAVPFSPEDFVDAEITNLEDLVLIGEEDLEGIPVYHLKGAIPSQDMEDVFGEGEGIIQLDYWIGLEDYRIRKIVIEMELLDEGGDPERIGLTADITFSDYDKEVVIEAP